MTLSPGEMVIDDRLATVLATPVTGIAGQRIQYRQLLDLLGRMQPDFVLPAPALARLAELDRDLPPAERSEILRSSPATLRHPGLILRLATQEPLVAAAAISAARLDDWQWSALIARLPLAARGHARHRRDLGPRATAMLARFGIGDLGLPPPDAPPSESSTSDGFLKGNLPEDPAGDVFEMADFAPIDWSGSRAEPARPQTGIGAIVRRIEAYRLNRQAASRQFSDDEDDPRLPLNDPERTAEPAPATTLRFATDARGQIVWTEDGYGGAMVGLRLGTGDAHAPSRCDAASVRAIRQRRPLRKGRLEIDGAPRIGGVWRIDATPQFDATGGRFIGYRGVLRRPSESGSEADVPADRLRQLLHELRTPINAIQGFAELIQQQLLGPTPHQYRSLAAGIAADSAAILAGFEELDLLVQLETGQVEPMAGSIDLAELVARLIGQLAPSLALREARFAFDSGGAVLASLPSSVAERMVWRLLAAIAAAAAPGEQIAVELETVGVAVELSLALPAALASAGSAELYKVASVDRAAPFGMGLLGGGFALRLVRAEARAVGGSLDHSPARLRLQLPGTIPAVQENTVNDQAAGLTAFDPGHSPHFTATAASGRSGR